jgi:4-hydroxyacetophenone monooxygenase
VTLSHEIQAITEDDDAIAAALGDADLPALLPALAYLLGDLSLLRDDLRIDPLLVTEDQAGLTPEQQRDIRRVALDALVRFRDGGSVASPPPDEETLQQIIGYLAGGAPMDHYMPMLREEMALTADDPRAPQWRKEDIAPDRPYRVAIIGAGMSGIVAAYRLEQAGVPYVVFDKNPDVGGTWLENTYPGCRVDIPNHYYSYSFAQRDDWPYFYSPRSELHRYFEACVDEFGIRSNLRLDTEVSSVNYDDATATWTLNLIGPDGEEAYRAQAVISAVGQLNRPSFPSIQGRDRFAGPCFHSAEWDHDVDLAGKRVGVIGTGCSAVQFVPIVAKEAAQVEIFQRTPNWMFPVPNYHDAVPAGFQWLLRHVPYYRQWYRFWLFWKGAETLRPISEVDPDWPDQHRSVSALNDTMRGVLSEAITVQYADRPDLLEKLLPDYPPAAKRIIVDGGVWAEALHQDHVALTVEGIERIVEDGVVTVDGRLHPFDVLIFATGFHASQFLTPMKVVGRGGVDLHEAWAGDARAYLGTTLPGFPNFFLLYGPNTNIVINGSIIWFSECEVRYVIDHIRETLTGGYRGLDCRQDVHDAYNAAIDAENARMVWGVSTVNSWYKNANGRVAQNWPYPLIDFWHRTRAVDINDYEPV